MPDLVTAIIVVGLIAAAMAALVWLAARARRRGTAGSAIAGAMAAYDEGMHGTAHDAFVEMQEQDERVVPLGAPDSAGSPTEPHPPSQARSALGSSATPRSLGSRVS